MLIRKPVVSGRFYSDREKTLKEEIKNCFSSPLGPGEEKTVFGGPILGGVVPHAGYMFSGPVAAWFYKMLKDNLKGRVTYIIIGPNHTGRGSYVSLYPPDGSWETPLGQAKVNRDLAEKIAKSSLVEIDKDAHSFEHSIEVQLPFLQTIQNDFDFVPICMLKQDLKTTVELGNMLGENVRSWGGKVVFIASSDFSHYIPPEEAKDKDLLAINEIEKLNVPGLMQKVKEYGISMCGYGPIGAVMAATKILGAKEGKVLRYGHSGDVSPMADVVGYASIIFV